MRRIFNNNKTEKIISTIVVAIMAIGLLFGIVSLFRNAEKKTKTISPSYAVGALTEDGKYKECTNALYTKDAFECQGLKVSPIFESSITYSLYFYHYDGTFIYSETNLNSNFKKQLPIDIATCRIVINTEDEDIKIWEKRNFTSQLTIEVNKEQLSLPKRIANGETYFDTAQYEVSYTNLGQGYMATSSKEFVPTEEVANSVYQFNEVVRNRKVIVLALDGTVVNENTIKQKEICFYSSDVTKLVANVDKVLTIYSVDNIAYVYFDVSELSNIEYAGIADSVVSNLSIYAIYAI